MHVHSGTACTDALLPTAVQGGHYYTGAADPWATVGYLSTTEAGAASFQFSVTDPAKSIAGKAFIVHNNAGGRVACGILSEVTTSGAVKSSSLAALATTGGVTAQVTVYTTATHIIGAGQASGLEASLKDASAGGSSCTATNGCGVHVHSGTACTDAASQGGHYYKGSSDPWANVRYSSTSTAGAADFIFSVADSATDVTSKPFVVHNNAGGRVSCGLLCEGGCAATVVVAPATTTKNNWAKIASAASHIKIGLMGVMFSAMLAPMLL